MDNDIAEKTILFEAVKISARESVKDGYVVNLATDPSSMPNELFRVRPGQRMYVTFTLIDDDETPADVSPEGARAVKTAATLCRNERFQKWMEWKGYAAATGEGPCSEGLRRYLRIDSRSVLKTDPIARRTFDELTDVFYSDLRKARKK